MQFCDTFQLIPNGLENVAAVLRQLDPKKSQIISFRRKDCYALNKRCREMFVRLPSHDYRHYLTDDKVCCTKNAVVTNQLDDEEIRVSNGEIYYVLQPQEVTDRHIGPLLLDDGEDNQLLLDNKHVRAARMQFAWARTIHTFQGSEVDTIVYVLGQSSPYQNRQHVYTAVTRGKGRVVIAGFRRVLDEVLLRDPPPRQSSLAMRLRNEAVLRPGMYSCNVMIFTYVSDSSYANASIDGTSTCCKR